MAGKTLTLDFSTHNCIEIRLTGLSFKALERFGDILFYLYRNEITNQYTIDVMRHHIDGKTAKPSIDFFLPLLQELYEAIPFQKIKIIGFHHITPEELLTLIKNKE